MKCAARLIKFLSMFHVVVLMEKNVNQIGETPLHRNGLIDIK